MRGGIFQVGFFLLVWEATGKVCGVLVAMPLGQSRAPPSPSEQQ
jgi:hypothetical protein